MVRTEMRVPTGTVTYTGVFMTACSALPGSLERGLSDRVGLSPADPSESNLSETMSVRLYLCTVEPTWKLISLSVPPMNLPLIRLPFFSSKESAHATDVDRHSAMTNPQFNLNFMMTSPLHWPMAPNGWMQLKRHWMWF
jgi:hypothetical protein